MDFSAFEERTAFARSAAAAISRLGQYTNSSRSRKIWVAVQALSVAFFVLASLFMFIFSLAAYLRKEDDAPLGVVIIFFGAFILTVSLVVYAFVITGKHIAVMQKFAKDNRLTFHPWIRVDPKQGFAFSVASTRFARNGVVGKVYGRTFWMYEYRFMTGSGRHPYPNIFTVMMVHLDKSYPETLLINKKGRLKMILPRGKLHKVDSPWHNADGIKLYAENGRLSSETARLLSQPKIDELLQISPKAEVQLRDKVLTVFLPGKPVPSRQEAEGLISFTKNL